ncbi:hypothetical protein SADUNF_Sadunf08G0091500 [Salix dunnii]|uniref:Uncharacterized protein n=1 Tax=Salix dunnii TaxID=1413687 RepID=A0A835K1Z3_9ROSI|nr:hypothetical protein SADUNF_Sadunf08G0091500 [Salix dunnii]
MLAQGSNLMLLHSFQSFQLYLVERGKRCFDSMLKDHGTIPFYDHCSCMTDLFSRAGRHE